VKKKSLAQLKAKAWTLFSEWVRRSNADWRGYVACVTCGAQYVWNSGMIHAGHWIHDKLDYDERNVHPQCRNCNYKYNKNTNTAYAIYMARKYGHEEMERIRELAYLKGNLYTYSEVEELIEIIKLKIKSLDAYSSPESRTEKKNQKAQQKDTADAKSQ
jgi:hypothetical protein